MWTLLTFGIVITRCFAQYAPEEDLVERRRVLDRKQPYRKLKKYLSCQVCQVASQSIHKIWLVSRKDKELDEDDLFTLTTDVCNPWSNIGTVVL